MSFHGHRPPPSSSSQASRSAEMSSTASGMYQAAQALGSIGAPDTLFSSGGGPSTAIDGGGGGGSGSGYPGLPTSGPGSASASSAPPPGTGRLGQVENRRRSTLYGRQPEELHMHSTVVSSPGPPSPLQELPRTQHQGPAHSIGPSYGGAPPPHINLHQATPQPPGPTTASSGYGKPSAGAGLPVVLQPGSFNRPPASSTNTAPATVPTMLQIQTQSHQSPSGRSASIGHSHGYSRSSPSAGFDGQKYVPYPGTPDTAKYASPISAKTPLTTYAPFGAISNSPLGLADIRPGRGGHGLSSDGLTSPNPYSPVIDDDRAVATISNYLAPWPVYALDWCKWPVYPHGRRRAGGRLGAGKVAIGSYLEDGGNMVCRHGISLFGRARPATMSSYPDPPSLDTNLRRRDPTVAELGSFTQPGVHQAGRSDLHLPGHPTSLGATFIAETVDGSVGDVGRSSPTMVVAEPCHPDDDDDDDDDVVVVQLHHRHIFQSS